LHEEFLRGRAQDVLRTAEERGELKGEITLLIGQAEENEVVPAKESVGETMKRLMEEESLEEKDALKRVAKELGVGKSEAYREWQRTKR
jgi:16S rRNA (cytidine1402-2'-O)-methyltransferase